jgi:hypothetical protein
LTIDVDISGFALRFEGLSPALLDGLKREWPFFVRPAPGPPALTIRIEDDARAMAPGRFMEGTLLVESTPDSVAFRRDEGEIVQEVEGARAVVRLAQGDAGRRFWGLVNLTAAAVGWRLQQTGGGVVHAAGVVIGARAFLLVGPSGSGKTTFARTAAEAGVPVLSDDCVLVESAGGRLTALGSPFRAKEFPSPGPGRWPVAALLIPRWDAAPSLAPANRLMLEARIAANLLYSAPAWESDTGAEGSASAIAAAAPAYVLSFTPDASWVGVVSTIP